MIQTSRIWSLLPNLVLKAGMLLVIMIIAVTCLSCATGPKVVEIGTVYKNVSFALKNGGHAEVRFERLRRSYWSTGGWFQGAGGQQSMEVEHFYFVVMGTLEMPSGRKKEFAWIAPYMNHWSANLVRTGRLALTGDEVFIEYTLIPMRAEAGSVVKYGRYNGTKRYAGKLYTPLYEYKNTYKWPVVYEWEDVTKEEFERVASFGNVINLEVTIYYPFRM